MHFLRDVTRDRREPERDIFTPFRSEAFGGCVNHQFRCAVGRLPPRWRRQRAVTIPRVFSAETARALLEFQVGRNLRAIRAAAGHARPA